VIAGGAGFAARAVGEAERNRHATTALEPSLRWGSPELVESRSDFWLRAKDGRLNQEFMKARDTQSPAYYAICRLMDFLEDLAILEDIRCCLSRLDISVYGAIGE
jgi:hypothetical protein